jgi:hypothetical protein
MAMNEARIVRDRQPGLWVTDTELHALLGLDTKTTRVVLQELERKHPNFPKKQPFFGGRRYWPAIVDFFGHHYGFRMASAPGGAERRQKWIDDRMSMMRRA